MTERCLLCADIGTSSLKAALISESGLISASCRIAFPAAGGRDPAISWFAALCEASHRLKAELLATQLSTARTERTPQFIAGIVISGNGPTLTAVPDTAPDNTTQPYTLLWNTPASVQGPSLFIPRLHLLQNLAPESWNAARYILSGPEYLIWRLTGTAVTILPEERFRPAYWTEEALTENGIDGEKLPPFVPMGFNAGTLTPEAAEALGLPGGSSRQTNVYCGAPDWIAALIGTDTLSAGTACDRAGTSEGLNVCVSAPLNAQNIKNVQSIRTLPSVIPGLFNAGYLLPSTGKQFSEYRKNSCYRDLSAEECMARIFDPSAEGTFLEGASTKNTSPEDSDSERAQAQRLITNIAFQVRQGTEALRTAISDAGHSASRIAGADVTAFRLSGGQARNRLWNQLKADVLGIPLELTGTPDGELVGDAVIGFTGMGHFGSIAEGAGRLVSVSQTFYPDATAHARYTELYHQWLEASCAADTVNAADGAAKATQ